MKYTLTALSLFAISTFSWGGVGGSVGGTSKLSLDKFGQNSKYLLKSPQVIFQAGHSTIYMPIVETCLTEQFGVPLLRSLKPHSYLKELSFQNQRIESLE
jgi:hypothetical protein